MLLNSSCSINVALTHTKISPLAKLQETVLLLTWTKKARDLVGIEQIVGIVALQFLYRLVVEDVATP